MRDRLIKLILNTPVLKFPSGSRAQGKTYQTAQNVADHLLANGVIVPPCKLGDKVYEIWDVYPPTIMEYEVGCIVQKGTNDFSVELWQDIHGGVICSFSDIGKTVFLTKEEAEKALAERSGE